MKEEDCFYLGYFSKVIGSKGEISLTLDVDQPETYLNLKSLMVKINERDQLLVPFFIDHTAAIVKNNLRLTLRNIQDAAAAKKMVGKSVFLPLAMLPKLNEKQFYFHEIIGYKAVDEKEGEIGLIKNVLEHPAQQILQVNGKEDKEVLIPLIDEFIVKVDRQNQLLHLKCPDGLIELYTQSDG